MSTTNKEIAYQDINNYLNNLDKNLKPIQKLIQLTEYIQRQKLELTYEDYTYLIKENTHLETILNNITQPTNYNKLQPIFDKLKHSIVISSLIDVYCILNNIEINESNLISELQISHTKKSEKDSYYPYEYLLYIRQIPKQILTKEEEQALFSRLKKGEIQVKQELIEKNLLLVVKIANYYYNTNNQYQILDLIQEGNLGLMHAIDKFDVDKGYKFSTYAYYWIKNKINRYLINQTRTIQIPEYKYYQEKNNQNELTYLNQRVISNYSPNETHNYYDTIKDPSDSIEDIAIKQKMQKEVQEYLAKSNLEPKYLDVLNKHFGLNQTPIATLKEIGNLEGLTQEAIRSREKTALSKLRKTPEIKSFAVYMDNPDQAISYIIEESKETRGRPRKL